MLLLKPSGCDLLKPFMVMISGFQLYVVSVKTFACARHAVHHPLTHVIQNVWLAGERANMFSLS